MCAYEVLLINGIYSVKKEELKNYEEYLKYKVLDRSIFLDNNMANCMANVLNQNLI